ncbi:MAG: hypothetical protein V3R54_08970, partial [Thermodesulfovibrionia bacterium]
SEYVYYYFIPPVKLVLFILVLQSVLFIFQLYIAGFPGLYFYIFHLYHSQSLMPCLDIVDCERGI